MDIFLYCFSISSRRLQSHTFWLVVLNIVKPIHGAYRKMYFLNNLIKTYRKISIYNMQGFSLPYYIYNCIFFYAQMIVGLYLTLSLSRPN